MLVSEFLIEINDNLRSLDDDPPTFGTDEANYWLRVANRIRRNLYKNTKKNWSSTWDALSLGTISASTTPSFNIGATFIAPANNPYVIDADGHRHNLSLIEPQEQKDGERQVFIAGRSPQVLHFTEEIRAAEAIVGGTLYLPGYYMPAAMDEADGTVIVDDEDWLAMATAAEIAFNDLTYEDKSADLNQKANALYSDMVATNRKRPYGTPNVTPTMVRKIRGTGR